jgi:methionine-rich copper-binding protein CopC
MMRWRALLGALGITALTLLCQPLPASAHATLVSSDPVSGSIIDELPDAVTLTFDEAVEEPAFVTVTAPDGTTYDTGDPIVVDAQVSQPLSFGEDEGTYTIAFRVARGGDRTEATA